MNRAILMGRITRDAEVRYTQGSEPMAIAHITLAVDRVKHNGDAPSADFITCVAFGKRAEFLEKYGKKGTKFVAEGRIQTGSYTNKEGVKIYTTNVAIDNIEFAESKRDDSQPAPAPQGDSSFMNIPEGIEEELPFK